jgi:hypothetical protein
MVQKGPNEDCVQEYFEALGWAVTKLKLERDRKAADFRVSRDQEHFLCEVKTVESARANFPFTPLEYYMGERQKRHEEAERWMAQNPDKRLVLHKSQYEFIFGDECDFQKEYRRTRHYQDTFEDFAGDFKEYFTTLSPAKDLPYTVRLDSDDLYAPAPDERDALFSWLDREIQAIHQGRIHWSWNVWEIHEGFAMYSNAYEVPDPFEKGKSKARYEVSIWGPNSAGPLEAQIHSYGTLNLAAISRNVEKGVQQLESSASQEACHQVPRVIVLGLKTGITFDWGQLLSHITWLLKAHPSLSAVAVLKWVPDGSPPQNVLAWGEFYRTTPQALSFLVLHNSWLQDVKALPVDGFSDKWASHICPIDESAFSNLVI